MRTASLRASLLTALLLVLLAVVSTAAQTATAVPTGPSLPSQPAPLSNVWTIGGGVPVDSAPSTSGDQRPRTDPQPAGPIKVVSVRNAFVVAPEVRFGQVNHQSATFVGAKAGMLLENRLFLGAGGYWLANNHRGFEMGYAGGIVGWYLRGEGPVDLSLTALVGGGWSTMTWVGGPVPLGMGGRIHQIYPQPSGDSLVRAWYVANDFFIAEPEANVCFRVSRNVWFSAGVAYRFISGAYALDSDLRGVTGSVAVTFGRR